MEDVEIPLDRAKPIPVGQQIRTHLERLISDGFLAPGVKLPASRELARQAGVNRTTVTLAYDELVARGLLRAHVGQGTFVAEGRARPAEARVTARSAIDWSGLFSKGSQLVAADLRRREMYNQAGRAADGVISFAGGMPDSGLFPTEAFRQVLNRVIRAEGAELLQYYPARGYPPLRRFLATYLLRFGVEARPEEILIVNGSQQGFDLIARTLVDPGDFVAIEQPSYPRAIQVFRSFGAQLLPVPTGETGLRLDALERVLERHAPKLLYCQPTAHNPTGLTMPAPTRRRLLELAGRLQVPVVEDGFDGSLFYEERPPAPLKADDRQGLVLYIGTFSKILFPGLRLGWLVAPPAVLERLVAAKQLADIHTSPLIQAAVYHFCQRRLLDRHLKRSATEYGRRRALLLRALGRWMPKGVSWTETQGGFFLLLTLPEGVDAMRLLPLALERGVTFTPGSAFFLDGEGEGTLRLSFSSVAASRIEEGVRRLAAATRDLLRRPVRREVERATVPLV
jgi:GntR family transcriptional regulator/MocR family aminotransferase